MGVKTSAFNNWQAKQRELHSVETLMRQAAREPAGSPARLAEADLQVQAQVLRDEVDRLFPLAMQELEEGVRRLKDKRPRLHQP